MKPTIICVVGTSGSGKTSMVNRIEEVLGIKTLVSYTTRPKRKDEVNGRNHYFVTDSEMPPKSEMLAYTVFGGYHYWTAKSQIPTDGGTVTYVIDEKGLVPLMEDFTDQYNIKAILVKRNMDKITRDIDKERLNRDRFRVTIDEETYDAVIENNDTLDKFFDESISVIQSLIK